MAQRETNPRGQLFPDYFLTTQSKGTSADKAWRLTKDPEDYNAEKAVHAVMQIIEFILVRLG